MEEPGKTITPHRARFSSRSELESRDCQRSSDGFPIHSSMDKRKMVWRNGGYMLQESNSKRSSSRLMRERDQV